MKFSNGHYCLYFVDFNLKTICAAPHHGLTTSFSLIECKLQEELDRNKTFTEIFKGA